MQSQLFLGAQGSGKGKTILSDGWIKDDLISTCLGITPPSPIVNTIGGHTSCIAKFMCAGCNAGGSLLYGSGFDALVLRFAPITDFITCVSFFLPPLSFWAKT